jgi:hypothetical protein
MGRYPVVSDENFPGNFRVSAFGGLKKRGASKPVEINEQAKEKQRKRKGKAFPPA